jgi:endo-1,4-beta-D-glucanase Y
MKETSTLFTLSSFLMLSLACVLSNCVSIPTNKAERITKQFVLQRMGGPEGSVLTSGKVRTVLGYPINDDDGLYESGVLSESAGLFMMYAVLSGDKEVFDRQLKMTQSMLLDANGLFYWKVDANGKNPARVSAIVDDIRIAHASILAFDLWKEPRYRDFAKLVSDAMLSLELNKDGQLVDFLNWREQGEPIPAATIRLSYIDIEAMNALLVLDPRWANVRKNTGKLLLKGQTHTGLYYERFNYKTNKFESERQNVINQFYCALFAMEIESGDSPFLGWLRKSFERDGKVYAEYDCLTGEPTKFFESSSVYALAARYALKLGDLELAKALMGKLLSFQNKNRWSPMYGGFYDDEVFSFDNLEALITLNLFNRATK